VHDEGAEQGEGDTSPPAAGMRLRASPETLRTAAAAPTSSTDTSGKRSRASGGAGVAGSARRTPGATTAVAAAIAPKAHRQCPSSAKTPPTAGPTSRPAPHIIEITALARGHAGRGSVVRMSA